MIDALWPWLAALLLPPLVVAILGGLRIPTRRLRVVAVACAGATTLAGVVPLLSPDLAQLRVAWPWIGSALVGTDLIHVTDLSAPLLGLPPGLWLVTVLATPHARLDRRGLRRTALATSFATCALATNSPILLAGFWVASSLLYVLGLSGPAHRRERRVLGYYLWPSSVLVSVGIVASTTTPSSAIGELGLWLVLVAVFVRKGIFPFHAWIPEAFERGRLGPSVLFGAPQLGTYVAATLVFPHASDAMLETAATLSLITAIYGAALATIQRDARRACGYLFVSQSALVLAGVGSASEEGLAGALMLWISSALAFTGLARIVLALEARRGRLDLRFHHGGFDQMPVLAASFLVLGLACTGFPGTLGFVGQELLVDGLVRGFPLLGFLTVGASAFTGLAVLRMYFSLFCGSRPHASETRLLPREAIAFGAVASLLVLTGMAPKRIVESRLRASDSMFQERDGNLQHAAPSPRSAERKSW